MSPILLTGNIRFSESPFLDRVRGPEKLGPLSQSSLGQVREVLELFTTVVTVLDYNFVHVPDVDKVKEPILGNVNVSVPLADC